MIAEHWNFPVVLVDAIHFHHVPSLARVNQALPAIVNVANSFTADYQLAHSALLSFQLHPDSLVILKLTPQDLERTKQRLMDAGIFPHFSADRQET